MACMKIIPQDIIIDILHRVPAKSVGLCRCVSKEWLSLLSKPGFIETHPKTLNIMFGHRDSVQYFSVPLNNLETVSRHSLGYFKFQRHGSVNGLILASKFRNLGKVDILFLFNPTTTDYVELPLHKQVFGMLGFGYDSVTDDYKVVSIACTGDYLKNNVYVYSLRRNTWKQVTDLRYNHSYYWLSGVFVNGFLYWIVKRHSKLVIVAFSLADEKLSELPPPNLYDEVDLVSVIDTKLVVLGEKLAIFDDMKGDLWLMNEYGVERSWTKIVVHGFNDIPMIRTFSWLVEVGRVEVPTATPKVFYESGKYLFLTSNQLGIYDRMWIYNVEQRTFCKSVDISYMNIKHDYVICTYAESLSSMVSPNISRSE